MRGDKNMKKLMIFAVPLLLLTSCNAVGSNPGSHASSQSNCNSTNPTMPIPDLNNLEPFKLNNPNKPFNTETEGTLDANYIKSLREFALDFIQETHKEEMDDNPVFSPYSIATCYSMADDAAAGKTKEELDDLLHYDGSFDHLSAVKNGLLRTAIDDEAKNTYVNVSQSAWIDENSYQDGFNDEYSKILEDYYFAEFYKGPLSHMYNEVADWINNKTKNYLEVKGDDFKAMLESALFALINTVYFKSSWLTEFDEAGNYTGKFTDLDGVSSEAIYMQKREENQYYYKASNYRIGSIPFEHGLEFRILLPDLNTNYSEILDDRTALSKLLTLPLNDVTSDEEGETKKDEVRYIVPQFKVRTKYNLVQMFLNMGIRDPFSVGANFPPIGGFIGSSIHDAGFEINNNGGEGAAYTIIVFDKGAGPEYITLNCNHPFAYAVTTSDGIPLFMGKVTNFKQA